MYSASSLFLLSFCFRNLLLEIFSERAGNFCGFFIRQDQVPDRRGAGGEAQGADAPPAAAQGPQMGGARPCPWDPTSRPSDAYLYLPNNKGIKPSLVGASDFLPFYPSTKSHITDYATAELKTIRTLPEETECPSSAPHPRPRSGRGTRGTVHQRCLPRRPEQIHPAAGEVHFPFQLGTGQRRNGMLT